MKVPKSFSFRSLQQCRWARSLIGALGFALLQGCAVNAPSCDGRFEPINVPAPASVEPAQEDRSAERDTGHE